MRGDDGAGPGMALQNLRWDSKRHSDSLLSWRRRTGARPGRPHGEVPLLTPYGNAWDLLASAMEAGFKLQLPSQWQPISWSAEVPEARLTTYATQPYYGWLSSSGGDTRGPAQDRSPLFTRSNQSRTRDGPKGQGDRSPPRGRGDGGRPPIRSTSEKSRTGSRGAEDGHRRNQKNQRGGSPPRGPAPPDRVVVVMPGNSGEGGELEDDRRRNERAARRTVEHSG